MSEKSHEKEFEDLMRGVKPLPGKKAPKKPSKSEIEVKGELRLPPQPKEKFHGFLVQPKRFHPKIDKHFQPDRVLDLHGEFREQALQMTKAALLNMPRFHQITLLLITGKGLNSPEGPVLKQAVWEFLHDWREEPEIDFQWAPKHLGGEGAILLWRV